MSADMAEQFDDWSDEEAGKAKNPKVTTKTKPQPAKAARKPQAQASRHRKKK